MIDLLAYITIIVFENKIVKFLDINNYVWYN